MYIGYKYFVRYVIKNSFPNLWLSFHFLTFLILMKSHFSLFSFMGYVFDVMYKNFLFKLRSQKFSPLFSSTSFVVLYFILDVWSVLS